MITIKDRTLMGKIADGASNVDEVASYLIDNYPAGAIAKSLAEVLMTDVKTDTPITVSETEYERICSLFRVRGLKVVDGEIIRENRGRPTKKG